MIPDFIWLKINEFYVRIRFKWSWDTILHLVLPSHTFIPCDWMLRIYSEPLNSCALGMEIRHPIYRSVVVKLAISPRAPAVSSRHQSLDNLPEETSVAEVTVFNAATSFLISISKENLSTTWNFSFAFFWNQTLKATVFSKRKKQHFFHQPRSNTVLQGRCSICNIFCSPVLCIQHLFSSLETDFSHYVSSLEPYFSHLN